MRRLASTLLTGLVLSLPAAAWAQAPKGAPKSAPAPAPAAPEPVPQAPSFVAVPVPGLQIASHSNLVIEAVEIAIGVDRVTHSYRLRNKGGEELRLAASIQLPAFAASLDGSEVYRVATNRPENPVDLTVTVDGAPVTASTKVTAFALGLDRTAELKSFNLPLMPYGPEVEKAIAGLTPDQSSKLVALGLLSPPDPEQPGVPPLADWTLSIVYGWEQTLPPQKTATLAVSFRPISGSFELNRETASVLDEIKDEACLPPPVIKALKSRVQGKNAVAMPVTELAIANESPARWTPSPEANVAVTKPASDVTVAFCGMDQKSATANRVTGKAPDPESNEAFRVLLFGAAAK